MQRLVPQSLLSYAVVASAVAGAAMLGAFGVLATRGGDNAPAVPHPASKAWQQHEGAAFSVETPRGWRVARDSRGWITARDGRSTSVVIWPVFVGARLDENSARVIAQKLATKVRPEVAWSEAASGDPRVARLVGRSPDGAAISLFTYAPTAHGTAGYAFTAAAPRSLFAGSTPTFARIIGSFQARGKPVARAASPRYQRWTDPVEGAFSVQIPEGWSATGGTQRPSNLLVQASVQATSADSEVAAAMTDALPLYVEPNATLEYGGISEGGTYTDPTGYSSPVRRYAPGAQYLRDYVLPTRGSDAQITHLRSRPDLAAQLTSYGINRYDAGEVEYTFERNGVPYTGGGVSITERVSLSGYTAWHVWRLFLVQAPTARFGEGVAALERLAGSLTIDRAWAQRQSETTAQQSGIIARMNDDVRETLSSGYWGRQRVYDALSERRSKATLEVEDVLDDAAGVTYRVDSGSDYYWIDPSGAIVGTNTDTRPDVDFREIVRLDG